jgi:CheY-like chemotaxis protein
MMPVMDGVEFMSACRESDVLVTIPVVVVTAYEALARQHAHRVAGIVKKPIDLDRLLDFVRRFCGEAQPERPDQNQNTT